MGRVRKSVLRWSLRLAGLVVAGAIAYFVLDTGWPNPYSPPTGGESFEATGKLYRLGSKESSMDRAVVVRDLTEHETAALRYFIEEADYEEVQAFKDQVDMVVVRIDGIDWFVYRSGLFRKRGGDSRWRKSISGLQLSPPGPGHNVDFDALLAWHEAEK
jgi:hypothetical protein